MEGIINHVRHIALKLIYDLDELVLFCAVDDISSFEQ